MKSFFGTQPHKNNISLDEKSDYDLANELDIYSNCFNVHDFSHELSVFKGAVIKPNSTVAVHVNKERVQRVFQRVKERKSLGPDGIRGRVLRNCANSWQTSSALSSPGHSGLTVPPACGRTQLLFLCPKINAQRQ